VTAQGRAIRACPGPEQVLPVHATTIAFDSATGPRGVLIRGASGAGKTTLALDLIAAGARLVADDRTVVFARDGAVFARAPRRISGLAEARGLGLIHLPTCRLTRLSLVIDLDGPAPARLPEPRTAVLAHTTLPLLRLPAHPARLGLLARIRTILHLPGGHVVDA
jgi:HPr kinase/phosphorylase